MVSIACGAVRMLIPKSSVLVPACITSPPSMEAYPHVIHEHPGDAVSSPYQMGTSLAAKRGWWR